MSFVSSFFTYNGFSLKSKQILEYHPQMLQEYLRGGDQTSFMYPRLGHSPEKFCVFFFIFLEHDAYDYLCLYWGFNNVDVCS